MSFEDDIKRFADKAEKAAEAVFRGTAIDLFTRIIKRTPIDTGRLRGNWQAALNQPILTETNNKANRALSQAGTVTKEAKTTDSIYLTNNLPYAGEIEDGHSKQAPYGMVKLTIAEFKYLVDRRAKAVK